MKPYKLKQVLCSRFCAAKFLFCKSWANFHLSYMYCTIYREFFVSLNFHKNGDFTNFVKNIFANDSCRQNKRCGMAILLWNLVLRLSKIHEICEIKQRENFPVYGNLTTFILSSRFVPMTWLVFAKYSVLQKLCLTKLIAFIWHKLLYSWVLWVMLKPHPEVEQVLTEI